MRPNMDDGHPKQRRLRYNHPRLSARMVVLGEAAGRIPQWRGCGGTVRDLRVKVLSHGGARRGYPEIGPERDWLSSGAGISGDCEPQGDPADDQIGSDEKRGRREGNQSCLSPSTKRKPTPRARTAACARARGAAMTRAWSSAYALGHRSGRANSSGISGQGSVDPHDGLIS